MKSSNKCLSVKAGAKIYGRFEELCDGQITPEAISKLSVEEIKAIGTSTAKANYIKSAASAVLSSILCQVRQRCKHHH